MPRRSPEAGRRAALARGLLLCAVTDRRRIPGDPVGACGAALRGGATAVLLRDRDLPARERRVLARRLRRATAEVGALLLVHGDARLAREVGADGVQVSAADAAGAGGAEAAVAAARRVLGGGRLVGLSTHSLAEARAAAAGGADHVLLGSVAPTASHPGVRPLGTGAWARAARELPIPVVAVGGVSPALVRSMERGVPLRVAAVEGLAGARDPERAAAALLAALAGGGGPRPSSKGGGGAAPPGGADERSLVAAFLAGAGRVEGLLLGPGDDAVVADAGGGAAVAACVDLVVEGVHFLPGTAARDVGFKAAARALSDLAAVGARPRWLLLGLALRRGTTRRFALDLERGAAAAARAAGARIAGGDTKETGGALTVAAAALGTVKGRPALPRGGARPGDLLLATGPFGGSILGRHLRPRARVAEGLALRRRGWASACIDVSDGLAADLHRLCAASGCGALVDGAAVPVHPDALRVRDGRSPLERALRDGEDHELLFAAPPAAAAAAVRAGIGTVLGRVVPAAAGVSIMDTLGSVAPLAAGGWVHLRAR